MAIVLSLYIPDPYTLIKLDNEKITHYENKIYFFSKHSKDIFIVRLFSQKNTSTYIYILH